MTQSNFGRKGFYFITLRSFILRSQGRSLKAGTKPEAMGECCLVTCSFLPQFRTTCLGEASPTVDWVLPYQSVNKKIPLPTCVLVSLMEALSQLRFLFPDKSSLCQVVKPTRTVLHWKSGRF